MSLLQSLFGPPMPSVSAAELNEKLKAPKRPFVVDVRQPEEGRERRVGPLPDIGYDRCDDVSLS